MRKTVVTLFIAGMLAMGAGAAHAQEESSLMGVVNDLYGAPYKSSGTTKNGFDCSGFTRYVFDALGVDLPHSSSAQFKLGVPVSRSDLQPGDLVFFNTNGRSVSHVGIYIGNGMFVHAESGKGVVNTRLNDPYYWGKRFVGAKRIALPVLEAIAEAPQKKKPVQAASLPDAKQQPQRQQEQSKQQPQTPQQQQTQQQQQQQQQSQPRQQQ
ncbi:C40 family peptidase [Brevibacillus thermoruber]|uniref:C40 family peptidase n=1 Tax=Brevibacillus thermoruber TaxID=33942 RepID=UPI0004087C8E|nr:C40 family peptidase [Brevibacillus thermoruber]